MFRRKKLNYKIRGEKEGKQIKIVKGALERFSNKCPYTEETEHEVNQAKLEGESSNRCEARENLFVEVTISCHLNSDWEIAPVFSKPITINIVELDKSHNGLLSTLK